MQSLKDILTVVILNIFISYGLLYLSNFILGVYPALNSFVRSSVLVNNSLFAFYGFIMVVFISPVSEELIFRGVLLNRLNLLLPMAFSIVISSILFAFLHGFGSITSAFIFAICMAILYLKTDNILVPIFAHFLNNFIAESIVIIDVGKVLFTNHVVMLIMSILAIISAIVILIQIKEQWNILNINKL
ncbi:CPBP family intramembrane glutamic endopeptidase [Methanobrevibacter sp.]|uniref:CPBP family intramembrane glutamic endopeptidase n=1 Tax=Methanobrevibacter sp. TaxID=66852 RepID=UPI003D7C9B6C